MTRQREGGESGKKTRITGLLTFSSTVSVERELSLKKQTVILNIADTSTNTIS